MTIEADDDRPEFSVYAFFADGYYTPQARFVGAEAAVKFAKRLTETPGGRSGALKMVRITDGDDYTCFQWEFGKGVTFK